MLHKSVIKRILSFKEKAATNESKQKDGLQGQGQDAFAWCYRGMVPGSCEPWNKINSTVCWVFLITIGMNE